MTANELKNILTLHLGDQLLRNGQVLYSGVDTLRPGFIAVYGFNPAADGTNLPLSEVPLDRSEWSAYVDQCWYCGQDRGCHRAGARPHQRRVVKMMTELDLKPETTFATNLIFFESQKAKDVYTEDLFNRCWKVHQEMLKQIRPTYILCLGNGESLSAFSLLRRIATKTSGAQPLGQWKRFTGSFDLGGGISLTSTVVGIRHPSYPTNTTGLKAFVER